MDYWNNGSMEQMNNGMLAAQKIQTDLKIDFYSFTILKKKTPINWLYGHESFSYLFSTLVLKTF